MATYEGAKRVQRFGQLFGMIGGCIGLLVWLVVYFGDLSLPAVFFIWPIGLGGVIGLIGIILERSVRSA